MTPEEEDPLEQEENEDPLSEEEIPDAATAAGLRKAQRRKRQLSDQSKEFWSAIFSTPIGRQEMWNLLREAHTFEERFACGPSGFPCPEATWFHAGEQSLGLRLYQTWLAIATDGVLQMHREQDVRFAPSTKPRRLRLKGDMND